MNAPANIWQDENQRSLGAALARVRRALAGDTSAAATEEENVTPDESALARICAAFGLSPFERDILLLCAGVELDSAFAQQIAPARPSFGLALATLGEAHWSALLPTRPLRYWRLLELDPGASLTAAPLRIDERILHHLAGLAYLDERLQGLLQPLHFEGALPPSQDVIAQRVIELWRTYATPPLIELSGEDEGAKKAIAASAGESLGMLVRSVRAADLPVAASERETLVRLWERETILGGGGLLLEAEPDGNSDAILGLVRRMRGPLLVAARDPRSDYGRAVVRLEVRRPVTPEQQTIWRETVATFAPQLNGGIDALTAQFSFAREGILAAGAELKERAEEGKIEAQLWEICRGQARQGLENLAQRIEPAAIWDDLVLPEMQRQVLREMASHVRQRATVYERWGFAAKGARGLGISALFAGESGTGKTMAAEVLANELRLDLYRIDLSSVVSKYIGETEKNLRRVFDAAEQGGAILLFDEADALFGKRSEVKDSHDRYANIEVSYLLQRMEAYRGLAILTTNRREALDPAFLRRIRFVVRFPFPDAPQRAEIWRRIFPSETPTEQLDLTKLSRLNVAGGNIRNVALNAAFLAADAHEPVRMSHLLRAARTEYNKLEKPLTEAEIGGWR
jgi:hypothetical protein